MGVRAACGSTDDHGAHVYVEGGHPGVRGKRWCGGNRDIVEVVVEETDSERENRLVDEGDVIADQWYEDHT